MFVSAIIPAAGVGRRFGSKTNKQFLQLNGKPMLYYSVKAFETSPLISEIILVVPEPWISSVEHEIVQQYHFSKIKQIIPGGKERFYSVSNGLAAVSTEAEIVAVHDGVRPFVSQTLIASCIHACQSHPAIVPAVPVRDTIKSVKNGLINQTMDRSLLWAVQTPQVFQYEILRDAYQNMEVTQSPITDDAMLVERLGVSIKIVHGDYNNIKITSPEDFSWAEYFLKIKSSDD